MNLRKPCVTVTIGRKGINMHVEVASCSDIGLVRDHNEDYIGSDQTLGIVALADGMGGHQAGEIASEIAVNTIIQEITKPLLKLIHSSSDTNEHYYQYLKQLLEQAVMRANQVIYQTAKEQVHCYGMGTTIVAAIFHLGVISIAHVGDSRLYRFRNQQLQQLTIDHSVLQELIDCGFFTPQQARHAPNRNLVTRALGVEERVLVDVQQYKVDKNDIYLLCSDGLNDMLEDEEIQAVLLENNHQLKEAAYALVEAANAKGGEDNVSVILVRPVFDDTDGWLKKLAKWWGK